MLTVGKYEELARRSDAMLKKSLCAALLCRDLYGLNLSRILVDNFCPDQYDLCRSVPEMLSENVQKDFRSDMGTHQEAYDLI
jgi:hypothetical protein